MNKLLSPLDGTAIQDASKQAIGSLSDTDAVAVRIIAQPQLRLPVADPFDHPETEEERKWRLELEQLLYWAERAAAKRILILGPIILVGHIAFIVCGLYVVVRVIEEELARLGMLFQ